MQASRHGGSDKRCNRSILCSSCSNRQRALYILDQFDIQSYFVGLVQALESAPHPCELLKGAMRAAQGSCLRVAEVRVLAEPGEHPLLEMAGQATILYIVQDVAACLDRVGSAARVMVMQPAAGESPATAQPDEAPAYSARVSAKLSIPWKHPILR